MFFIRQKTAPQHTEEARINYLIFNGNERKIDLKFERVFNENASRSRSSVLGTTTYIQYITCNAVYIIIHIKWWWSSYRLYRGPINRSNFVCFKEFTANLQRNGTWINEFESNGHGRPWEWGWKPRTSKWVQ